MNSFHLIFHPLLPPAFLEVCALLSFLVILPGLLRRIRGSLLRGIAFLIILLSLVNPSWLQEQHEPLKDTALVVVDDSASISVAHRTEIVNRALKSIMDKLASFADLTVDVLHINGHQETDLFEALMPKLASLPHGRLAGIIAITDGQIHDRPSNNLEAPFHVLIAGHKDDVDRRLVIRQAPAYGIVGQSVTLTLRIEDTPQPQSERATLTWQRDDGSSQTVMMPVGKDIPFDVPIGHAGKNLYAFTVETLPHELTTLNNTAAVNINGIHDRLRVLLISGEPHIGGRTWRNFLKTDPAVDLVHFTILRSPDKASYAPSSQMALINFPVHELFDVKLHSFDLVILDRVSKRSLISDDYLNNITHYVENGGALLVSVATDGPDAASITESPLVALLPALPTGQVLTGPYIPDLTDVGLRHPVTGSLTTNIPHDKWGPWFRQMDATQVTGDILMSGLEHKPLLVLSHVGQGRVAEFLSDQFWLWGRGYQGGGPQAELLRRVAHWLVQEPELDETALRADAVYNDNGWQLTINRQSLHENTSTVTLTDPSGQTRLLTLHPGTSPGLLTTSLNVSSTGLYQIKDDEHALVVMVGPADTPEFSDLRATDEKLAPIAEASGGGVYWLDDYPDGPGIHRTDPDGSQKGWGWLGLRKNGQYRITGSISYPLCPLWLGLCLALAVLIWGWRRESR